MRFFPNEVILSWPTPNYINPVTRGQSLVYVNSVLMAIVIITICLRLYTRVMVKRWFGADDAFIMMALIFDIGLTTCVLIANQRYGWGRHIYDIPINDWTPTSKMAFTAKILYLLSTVTTRLSLFALYYRLSYNLFEKSYRWILHANVAATISYLLCFISLTIFLCIPPSNYWTITSDPNTCVNEGAALLASGIINTSLDFLCTLLPIPLAIKLTASLRTRIAILVLFSLGFVVTGAGIIRSYYSYKSLIAEYDVTWYSYPLWLSAAVEVHLGIICASAPPLRPLLAKIPLQCPCINSQFSNSFRSLRLPSWFSKSSSEPSQVTNSTAPPEVAAHRDIEDGAVAELRQISEDVQSNGNHKKRQSNLCEVQKYKPDESMETQSLSPLCHELEQWVYIERCSKPRLQSLDSQRATIGSEEEQREDNQTFQSTRMKKRVPISTISPWARLRE